MDVKKFVESLGDRKVLAENEVKAILKSYDIKVPKFFMAKEEKDLTNLKLHFPLVMKVCSPNILHKTDVGGVKLNIQTKHELETSFEEMHKKFPGEYILIETMEKPGVELIVGLINDSTFGLTIMFGIGGILTELYKDVTFRVVPITKYDAEQMLTEIKARKLLEGFRGIKVEREAIVDLLLKTSNLAVAFGGYLDQMDLNPVFARENDVVVVDAKMLLLGHKEEFY